jgi:GT2 family glycosyltransferase
VLLGRGEAQHDGTVKPQREDPPYETEWVSGCAMLVNMRAVELVGGFDDRFYLTWEDVDWCLRMRKAHWKVAVVPPSRIYHKGGRSGAKLTGIRSYYAVRNSLLLAAKHGGLQYLSALVFVLGRHIRSALRSWRSEGPAILQTTLEGLWDHLRGRYGRRSSQLQTKELLKPLEPKDGVETFEGGEGCGLSK